MNLSLLAQGAGSFLGAAANYYGQREANETNVMLSRQNMQFQRDEADRQMNFQQHMSNTSHQRAVNDLRAAGLNPILALGSNASSPAGAAGQGAMAQVENEMEGTVSSAMEGARLALAMKKQKAEVNNLEQQNNNLKAQEEYAKSQKRKSDKETKLLDLNQERAKTFEKIHQYLNNTLDRGGAMVDVLKEELNRKNPTINTPKNPNKSRFEHKLRRP